MKIFAVCLISLWLFQAHAMGTNCVQIFSDSRFYHPRDIQYLDHLQDAPEIAQDSQLKALAMSWEKLFAEADQEHFAKFGGRDKALESLQAELNSPISWLRHINFSEGRLLYGDSIDKAITADLIVKNVSSEVGYGVFAKGKIKKGEMIGEYTGIFRREKSGDSNNRYLFRTEFDGDYRIDAQDAGNLTRYINHSSNANARVINVFWNLRWHVILVALRDIPPGEQILFDYGPGYWIGREKPSEL